MPTQRYEALDSLRGLAALAVVIHHCLLSSPLFWAVSSGEPPPDASVWAVHLIRAVTFSPAHLIWAGGEAVVLFFVLSGFVLALPFESRREPPYATFLVRRICRIYLPFVAALILAAGCLALVGGMPARASAWISGIWATRLTATAFASNLFMAGQPEFYYINGPIWSLVHEMRISIVFPLLMLMLRIVRWPLVLAGFFLVSLVSAILLKRVVPPGSYGSLPETAGFMLNFITGAVIAFNRAAIIAWARRHDRLPMFILVACLLLLVGRWWIPVHQLWFGMNMVSPFTAGGIIIGVLASGKASTFLHRPSLIWLGRISYSLYLTHIVVLLVMLYCLADLLPLWLILLAVPFAALGFAQVTYILIEAPSIRLGRALTVRKALASTVPSV